MTTPRAVPDPPSPALGLCFVAASVAAAFAMAAAVASYLWHRLTSKENTR